jgi:hypothetical protein
MKNGFQTLSFFAIRGVVAGAAIGFLAGMIMFASGGETQVGRILQGGVLGLLYGALLTLIISLLAGIGVALISRVTSQPVVGIAIAALIGLFTPLAVGSFLFAGPFNDPSFITGMVLEGLVNGGIAFLYQRRKA